ncbi:MAG: peptide ABC transporter substrate-binding protein [Filifactoraceae bacterium]
MKKRLMALSIAAVMGITLLSGCGAKGAGDAGTGEQVITHNLSAATQTIDPALNEAVDGSQVLRTVFEGLTTTDENEKPQPGIAESWTVSEDGLTYTFKLRDAKWSDGQPVTAEDFAYSWKRVVDPKTAAGYAYQMYSIKNAKAITEGGMDKEQLGIKVIDEKTLEVILEAPTPYFLELTAFPCYYPVRKDMVEKDPEGWALNADTYISNGPFKVTKIASNDVIEVVKNPEYYDVDKIKIDKINYVMIVDSSTAFAAFQNGEIDYTEQPPVEQIVKMMEEKDPNFGIYPYIGTYYYCFNMNDEIMKNFNVRKALSLAIDRESIVKNVTKAGQTPATQGFVPPGVKDSTGKNFADSVKDTGIKATADIEGAKAALAEAGYPDGKGLPALEILYNTNDGHKAIAEAIQEMWKKNLGIEVTLRNEEWAVFQESRKQGNYQVARHGWIGDYTDPMTFLELMTSTAGTNDAKYNNPKYDELIAASKLQSGADRDKTLLEAEKLIDSEMPITPIYYYVNAVMVRPTIKGAFKSSLGPMVYKNAYLEK